jgi:hypothetical protein
MAARTCIDEKDKNRIQAAEMRFLRPTIRKTLKVNSLNDTISKYREN